MIALGRFAEARSELESRIEELDEVSLSEALGIVGALELAEGRPERAATTLGEALEVSARPIAFPGRSEATANFGLALLMSGRVEEGMERLREAQALFGREQDVEGLLQAIDNEIEAQRQLGLSAANP